ncbi:class I SAM-dependent methyltransferase [Paenibacillus chondroitinus]|uniref:Class I SAM-dependent methyltransferase n=1 Tax=Paenibacillus chondroitinus TaxID=59842 RepID=A0ABU6DDS5_9BACL|nr:MULTISPECIES: class I SAM-dependent methyltransferase [Paenibacillus]MCY9662368.1 class I SAM-dependent methyltransferase [Paenibacillus anseongense]MEB4795819.1 class I SAM-dependent methyltransferase [Paenibacillus chondroitinus]
MNLEKMSDFFTARVETYDSHMLSNGGKEGYEKIAQLIPQNVDTLLDLGCGTGLELDEIFKINPLISVTGIDLTKAMLDKLKEKHPNKHLKLINASYLDYDFGQSLFDVAISFQTMHHFSHEEKTKLYRNICNALTHQGQYIECDYMVIDQFEEDKLFDENRRIRLEQGISEGEFYHFDTPCTVDNQIKMLLTAGFNKVEKVWRKENTTILIASK